MDNYKINAKDAVESLEIQGLFEQLGYMRAWDKNKVCFEPNHIFAKDGVLTWLHNDPILFEKHVGKELTLPQLRDLVVLKRNDVKDANHHAERGGEYFITSDGDIYFWMGKWVKSTLGSAESLTATETSQPQDLALISGAEAELVAQAKKHIDEDHITRFEAATAFLCGEKVQFMLANGDFIDINSDTTLGIFEEDGGYSFRLKPKFITINGIEVPAPMERAVEKGETAWLIGEPLTDNFDGYFSTSAMCYSENYAFGWWNKEEKVKQVVAALRTILRGTNS